MPVTLGECWLKSTVRRRQNGSRILCHLRRIVVHVRERERRHEYAADEGQPGGTTERG